MSAPTLFISYCRGGEDAAVMRTARDIADRLRGSGIDAMIDQYLTTPPADLARWMFRSIESSDFVLVVCTKDYKTRSEGGHSGGAGWEAAIITQALYDDVEDRGKRIIPVTLGGERREVVPYFLRSTTAYDLTSERDFEALVNFLLGRPEVKPPLLALPKAHTYLGVERIHRAFPFEEFRSRLPNAKSVRILNTFIPNIADIRRPLLAALESGCSLEVIMLNPTSKATLTRADTLAATDPSRPFNIAGNILDSYDELKGILRQLPSQIDRNVLKVWLCWEIPSISIYQVDEYMLSGLFWYGRLAVEGPQLEMSAYNSEMAQALTEQFGRIQQNSVGPARLDEPEWINRNRPFRP